MYTIALGLKCFFVYISFFVKLICHRVASINLMGSLGWHRCHWCRKWQYNMYIPDGIDGPLCGTCIDRSIEVADAPCFGSEPTGRPAVPSVPDAPYNIPTTTRDIANPPTLPTNSPHFATGTAHEQALTPTLSTFSPQIITGTAHEQTHTPTLPTNSPQITTGTAHEQASSSGGEAFLQAGLRQSMEEMNMQVPTRLTPPMVTTAATMTATSSTTSSTTSSSYNGPPMQWWVTPVPDPSRCGFYGGGQRCSGVIGGSQPQRCNRWCRKYNGHPGHCSCLHVCCTRTSEQQIAAAALGLPPWNREVRQRGPTHHTLSSSPWA